MTRLLFLALRAIALAGDQRRLGAIVALAFATTSLGLLAAPRPALAWSANEFSSASESSLIAMQNQARASAGLKPLKLDTDLRTIARWRAKDMIERGYFSHTIKGTDRKVFWYMQHQYDYCFKVAGENIGTVTWEGASEDDATAWVFNAFMNSEGHRDNILGKSWDVVAVGAYKGPGNTFMWAVLFADSCSSAPKPTPKPDKPKPTNKPDPKPAATSKPEPRRSRPRSPSRTRRSGRSRRRRRRPRRRLRPSRSRRPNRHR